MSEIEKDETSEAGTGDNVVVLPARDDDAATHPAVQFAKDHPVMTVAGGLAVGALAAALIPRRNREYVTRKSSAFADAVTTAGAALLAQAMEHAEAAGSGVRNQAGALADRASQLGGAASDKVHSLLARPEPEPESLAERIVTKAGEIRERIHR